MHSKALPVLTLLLFACASSGSGTSIKPTEERSEESVSVGPQFYEVRGNGALAYLFGTVHLSDDRTKTLPAAVDAAFESSNTLYVEMKPGMIGAMQMLKLATLPKGTSLDKLVGPEIWERVGDRYEQAGRSKDATDTMMNLAPWVLLSEIAFLDIHADDAPVLDRVFSIRAEEDGKPIHGLETVGQQLKMFTDMPLGDQAIWLGRLLDLLDEYDAEGRSMGTETLDAWAAGDAESLYGLREQVFSTVPGDRASMERELLWVRNERFADGIDEALCAAPGDVAFVAVGAMHLPNPPEVDVATERSQGAPRRLGLAELLSLRGYSVKRLHPESGL